MNATAATASLPHAYPIARAAGDRAFERILQARYGGSWTVTPRERAEPRAATSVGQINGLHLVSRDG